MLRQCTWLEFFTGWLAYLPVAGTRARQEQNSSQLAGLDGLLASSDPERTPCQVSRALSIVRIRLSSE